MLHLATIVLRPEWWDAKKIMEEIQHDPFLRNIVAELQQGKPSKAGFVGVSPNSQSILIEFGFVS